MTPEQERQAFGMSLLVEDGDVVFDGVRLRKVEGRQNLLQALELRVLTPYGSDRFNVLYGLDYAQIFGSAEGMPMTRELIKLNLVRTLATDARVQEVRDVVFTSGDDARQLRRWSVEVRLDTAAGQDVTLALAVGAVR